MRGSISGGNILRPRISCREMVSVTVGAHVVGAHAVESAHELSKPVFLIAGM